eukprot:m.211217 g.211217  ORF g.211217 m.211217 type:complete len:506 (-) comp18573_c0_seq5:65-1582(-)
MMTADADHADLEPGLAAAARRKRHQRLLLFASLASVPFFINCQPSEAFLTKYLEEDKQLSDDDLDNHVWPADTYGSFAFMLPAGLLADMVGYRAVIAVGLICRELTRLILLYANGVNWMTIMQVTYAMATAANSVLFAYVYRVVDAQDFKAATAVMLCAYHLGNAVGSGIGQLMVSCWGQRHHLRSLFYASWAFTTVGVVCFVLLYPRPPSPGGAKGRRGRGAAPPSLVGLLRTRGVRATLGELRAMYAGGRNTLLWTWWWLVGYGASYIILNYYQTQFLDIDPHARGLGVVEIVIELLACVGAVLPAALGPTFVPRHTHLLAFATSFAAGACFLLSTYLTSSVYWSYVLNAVAAGVFAFQRSAASFVIASEMAAVGTKHNQLPPSMRVQADGSGGGACGAGGTGDGGGRGVSGNNAHSAQSTASTDLTEPLLPGGSASVDADEEPRYAVLFTANTFVALFISSMVQVAGQTRGLDTTGYFDVATVMEGVVCIGLLLAPLVLAPR